MPATFSKYTQHVDFPCEVSLGWLARLGHSYNLTCNLDVTSERQEKRWKGGFLLLDKSPSWKKLVIKVTEMFCYLKKWKTWYFGS